MIGCIPFEELGERYYDVIIESRRSLLLENIDSLWKKLWNRCWYRNLLKRPFMKIRECLEEIFSKERDDVVLFDGDGGDE